MSAKYKFRFLSVFSILYLEFGDVSLQIGCFIWFNSCIKVLPINIHLLNVTTKNKLKLTAKVRWYCERFNLHPNTHQANKYWPFIFWSLVKFLKVDMSLERKKHYQLTFIPNSVIQSMYLPYWSTFVFQLTFTVKNDKKPAQ